VTFGNNFYTINAYLVKEVIVVPTTDQSTVFITTQSTVNPIPFKLTCEIPRESSPTNVQLTISATIPNNNPVLVHSFEHIASTLINPTNQPVKIIRHIYFGS
jgi:hypothetical protein